MESQLKPLIDAIRARGQDIEITEIQGVPYAKAPEGVRLQMVDVEPYLPAPRAIRRKVVASDVRGFNDYVKKFATPSTQIYASDGMTPEIIARIDDHLPDTPSHIKHTCHYPCPFTHEWQQWFGSNQVDMQQKPFASFLERNARDIIKPNAAKMLELATSFRAVTITEFGSAVRLQDGQVQLSYTEKDKPGQIKLPETFEIGIPVFEGVAMRYPITARLRYTTREKALVLAYELDRPDLTLRTAHDDLLEEITKQTGISVFRAV